MPRIPDRWLDYSPTGTRICDTPFIALKCPLHEYYFNDDFPPEKRFTVNDVKTLIPTLSMVIDLTFTYKYYDQKAFDKLGIVHEKIPCIGHEVPNLQVLKRFFRVVDNFLQNKQDGEDGLIGVHCTHGVNRTGFIICSYMISKLGFTYENAVKEFKQARGHNIERENYLNRLKLYETNPLSFIHNDDDVDPKQGYSDGRRTKERVKPRWRHTRPRNDQYEPRELTSKMDYSYRRPNNQYFPHKYPQQFDSYVPRHKLYPNSMPRYNSYSSYNNFRGNDSRRRDYNRNDYRRPHTHVPRQNDFQNRCKFNDPRPHRFSDHHPPAELSH